MKELINRIVKKESMEEPWQFYYLRRKQQAEHTIRDYLEDNTTDLSEEAYQVVEHGLIHTKGKRVRPVLTSLVHDLVNGSSPLIQPLSILAELPHRGSLLEDDIDDNAVQRGGKIAAHHKFGTDATKEACDFLYRAPIKILNSLQIESVDKELMISEYMRLSLKAREGQQKDVLWGEQNSVPSLEEYLLMCEEKCAAFEYAIRVGAYFGGANDKETEVLVEAGNKTATAFQLIDDLLSLREGSDDYGSDITEGKKTVSVIVSVNSDASGILLDILNQHTSDPDLIRRAISLMTESGGIAEAKFIAESLVQESKKLINDHFPDSKYRRILHSIIDYGLTRSE